MIFQLKLISRQTLKLGAQNQEDFGKGLKIKLDLNPRKSWSSPPIWQIDWKKLVSPTHLPNCQFLHSVCCTKQICKYYWHHNYWNCVYMQDKSRCCKAWQCYSTKAERQSERGRRLSDVKNSRIVKRWQFGQKVEIGELAGKKGWSEAATNYSCQSVPRFWRPARLPTACTEEVQGDDQAVNVGKYWIFEL